MACDTSSPKRDCSHWPSLSGFSSDSAHGLGLFRYGGREKLTQKLTGLARPDLDRFVIRRENHPPPHPPLNLSLVMDVQHEKLPSYGSTLQQLLQAFNAELLAQIASGELQLFAFR